MKLANEEPKTGGVGWLGNFNDMAIKTCVRRLLSKYGYLSVEMQDAVSRDVDAESTALADRNDAIADRGNGKVIDTESAEYEEVDTSTGEVKAGEPQGQPAEPEGGEEAGPGY
jgi:recombination protein RecT